MPTIMETIDLVPAAVRDDATFVEAAAALADAGLPMMAVVDEADRVVGLFGTEEVVRGLLPRYLGDLRHTAFARDDAALLAQRASEVGDDPVVRHAVAPVTVDCEASSMHVGELFLHSRLPALAVVEEGRFAGMVDRREFARALTRQAGGGAAP